MAANFPNNPNTGDEFTSNGVTFTWDGSAWKQASTPGVKGLKGEKGEKGEKGIKGEKGEKGQKGEIGSSGNPGGKGDKGQKGTDGSDGTSVKGDKGQKGDDGDDGNKGEKGQKGTDGNDGTGIKGNKGETGADGDDGNKGEKGQKGVDGTSVKGDKGQKGVDGNDGSGTKGNKGEPGADGSDGTSVKGQKGESVKGDKGQKGVDGDDGSSVKGNKGQKGDDGSDGTSVKGDKGQKGADGDDGTSVKGQKGEPSTVKGQKGESVKGDKGQKGEQGASGTATISNNADNRVITGGTGTNLNAEQNLTFDGSTLNVIGSGTPTIESASNLDITATSTKFSGSASFAGGHPTSNFYSKADDLVVANFTQDTGISIFSGTSNQATISFGSTTFGTGALAGRLFYDSSTDDFIMQTITAQHHIKLQSAGAIELGSSNDVIMTIEDPDLAASHGVEVSGTIYPKAPVGNLGLLGVRWNNIYGNYLHGDGSNITNLPAPAIETIQTTGNTTTSHSFQTSMTITLTPTTSTSKLLITAGGPCRGDFIPEQTDEGDSSSFIEIQLFRGSTALGTTTQTFTSGRSAFYLAFKDTNNHQGSQVTYHLKFRRMQTNDMADEVAILRGSSMMVQEIM